MKQTLISLVAVAVLLILAGCLPTTTPTPTLPPPCTAADLVAPNLTAPDHLTIIGTTSPTLTWSFPGGCVPDSYIVNLFTGPSVYTDDFGGTVSGANTVFTPSLTLVPGMVYKWNVSAVSGGIEGPASSNRMFAVGPLCDIVDLAAPVPFRPTNGEVVTTTTPILGWLYPYTCIPNGYRVELSDDPSFSAPMVSEFDFFPFQNMIMDELPNCSLHYWRVAPFQEGTIGPMSAIFSYYVDSTGTCFPETIEYDLSGTVWHDLCAVPDGPLPDPIPAGCIELGGGAIGANGIREEGEPGIGNIVVRLGTGACPATDLGAVLTNANGEYHFLGLEPGTYCISIEALDTNNLAILIPGGWTAPSDGISDSLVSRTVALEAGTPLTDLDFGWDYQFLPAYIPVSASPMFTAEMLSNCRLGPGRDYCYAATINPGESYPIAGINRAGDWYLLNLGALQCWISSKVGSSTGDLGLAPHLADPLRVPCFYTPTPTPKAVPESTVAPYCSQFTIDKDCIAHRAQGCSWNSTTNVCMGP